MDKNREGRGRKNGESQSRRSAGRSGRWSEIRRLPPESAMMVARVFVSSQVNREGLRDTPLWADFLSRVRSADTPSCDSFAEAGRSPRKIRQSGSLTHQRLLNGARVIALWTE